MDAFEQLFRPILLPEYRVFVGGFDIDLRGGSRNDECHREIFVRPQSWPVTGNKIHVRLFKLKGRGWDAFKGGVMMFTPSVTTSVFLEDSGVENITFSCSRNHITGQFTFESVDYNCKKFIAKLYADQAADNVSSG